MQQKQTDVRQIKVLCAFKGSPVFWMVATSFVTALFSLMPTWFSENTLKEYELPMTRSEMVALNL